MYRWHLKRKYVWLWPQSNTHPLCHTFGDKSFRYSVPTMMEISMHDILIDIQDDTVQQFVLLEWN